MTRAMRLGAYALVAALLVAFRVPHLSLLISLVSLPAAMYFLLLGIYTYNRTHNGAHVAVGCSFVALFCSAFVSWAIAVAVAFSVLALVLDIRAMTREFRNG